MDVVNVTSESYPVKPFSLHMESERCECISCGTEKLRILLQKSHAEHPSGSVENSTLAEPSLVVNGIHQQVNETQERSAVYRLEPEENCASDLFMFLHMAFPMLTNNIAIELKSKGAITWSTMMKVGFSRIDSYSEVYRTWCYFRSNSFVEHTSEKLLQHITDAYVRMCSFASEYVGAGCGWEFERVHFLQQDIGKYHELPKSCWVAMQTVQCERDETVDFKTGETRVYHCFLKCKKLTPYTT